MGQINSDNDFVSEVLGAVSIIDLAQRIHDNDIRQMNQELWSTSCPFHDERTPSFRFWHYDNDKPDTFYCFGCCKGGNVISYVMYSFGKSPDESFQYICSEFGFQDPNDGSASPLAIKLSQLFKLKALNGKQSDIVFDASIIIRDILKEVKAEYGKESESYFNAESWADSQIKLVNILFDTSSKAETLERLLSQYRKRWFQKRSEFLNL